MRNKIILIVLALLLLAVGAYVASIYAYYSEGYRAGTIIKMSKKGILFKTHEGQLNTGGGFGSDGDVTSSIWHFSIARRNSEVLKQIEDAVDTGQRVKLHYKEMFFKHSWIGDTKYFVYKVEASGESAGKNNQNAIPDASQQKVKVQENTPSPASQPSNGQ